MHVVLILANTVSALLYYRPHLKEKISEREFTALVALTTIQEIFLSYNMFFILSEEKRSNIFSDKGRNIDY